VMCGPGPARRSLTGSVPVHRALTPSAYLPLPGHRTGVGASLSDASERRIDGRSVQVAPFEGSRAVGRKAAGVVRTSGPMMFRRRAIVRFAGAFAACALAWQTGGVLQLAAHSAMGCCASGHDATKCPCRYCTHHRSGEPLFEKCPGETHAAPAVALDVFAPARPYGILLVWVPATVEDAVPELICDRALKVPTPPPIA
jgi:hypothetical protein